VCLDCGKHLSMGFTKVLSNGDVCICQGPIGFGEEGRIGSKITIGDEEGAKAQEGIVEQSHAARSSRVVLAASFAIRRICAYRDSLQRPQPIGSAPPSASR